MSYTTFSNVQALVLLLAWDWLCSNPPFTIVKGHTKQNLTRRVNIISHSAQELTETSKQPIRTRYLGHVSTRYLKLFFNRIFTYRWSCVNIISHSAQELTETSKQPIRTRYLGHVTGYQPIRDQCFLIRSVPLPLDHCIVRSFFKIKSITKQVHHIWTHTSYHV
eukprot:sb/3472596/